VHTGICNTEMIYKFETGT